MNRLPLNSHHCGCDICWKILTGTQCTHTDMQTTVNQSMLLKPYKTTQTNLNAPQDFVQNKIEFERISNHLWTIQTISHQEPFESENKVHKHYYRGLIWYLMYYREGFWYVPWGHAIGAAQNLNARFTVLWTGMKWINIIIAEVMNSQ